MHILSPRGLAAERTLVCVAAVSLLAAFQGSLPKEKVEQQIETWEGQLGPDKIALARRAAQRMQIDKAQPGDVYKYVEEAQQPLN
ncbi:MAG: hypothetical protein KGI70_00145 [Patescibacteria group bacterium]|nr:hypothetical protein [Patescibacteria group bacterium]